MQYVKYLVLTRVSCAGLALLVTGVYMIDRSFTLRSVTVSYLLIDLVFSVVAIVYACRVSWRFVIAFAALTAVWLGAVLLFLPSVT